MNPYDDCRQQIVDWIADQVVANAGCSDVIAAYEELTLQIRRLRPYEETRSVRAGNPL